MKKILILTLIMLALAKVYCNSEATILAELGIVEQQLKKAEDSYGKWGEHVKALRQKKDELSNEALKACRR